MMICQRSMMGHCIFYWQSPLTMEGFWFWASDWIGCLQGSKLKGVQLSAGMTRNWHWWPNHRTWLPPIYMTRIKLPATWTYMYEKLVNISAWYMVQCNNYQSVHLRYVRTGMFVFSAILFCVLRYCCAVVPSSKKIAGCKCQVMADSPKWNSLVWPGRIRFWLFRYFSLSDKATEIQSKQKESNVSEKKTGDGDIRHRLGKQQN